MVDQAGGIPGPVDHILRERSTKIGSIAYIRWSTTTRAWPTRDPAGREGDHLHLLPGPGGGLHRRSRHHEDRAADYRKPASGTRGRSTGSPPGYSQSAVVELAALNGKPPARPQADCAPLMPHIFISTGLL